MRFFPFNKPRKAPEPTLEPVVTPEQDSIPTEGARVIIGDSGSRLMAVQKPWGHRLVLHGMNYAMGYYVLSRIQNRFKFGDPLALTSYQEAFGLIFKEAVKAVYYEKTLHEAGFHRHEMAAKENFREIWRGTVSAENLKKAQRTDETLEIGYSRKRLTIAGTRQEEVHIHRVKVIEVHEGWFRAYDGAGIRNYSISKVKWMTYIGSVEPELPYFIDILLNMGDTPGSYKLGLFHPGDKGLLDPYTALRTRGFYIPGKRGSGGARILAQLEEVESAND